MAQCLINQNRPVLLGFEDELVSEKHTSHVGYWTNKIGGFPDWPQDRVPSPQCKLCALPQLLVVQIYAPLENSPYHRTLYVFCCINPNCWNLSESWTCRRCEILDSPGENHQEGVPQPNRDWCAGANDWDDDNGNATTTLVNSNATDSDDSSSISTAFGAMRVDQCNANFGPERGSGAVGKTIASAEIEGDEGEVVSIDTPTAPQRDLIALLEATAPLPSLQTAVSFESSFIWVCEEADVGVGAESDHAHSLLKEYQSRHGDRAAANDDEKYERALPAHGDPVFHDFVMRIQDNPGQILRYDLRGSPLLMAPLESPRTCRHCQGALVFEMQLLPTLLNKLRLPGEKESHVDFGNVLIFSCRNSCWNPSDTYRDETVCVQVESALPRTN